MIDDIDNVIRDAEAASADAMHYSAAAADAEVGPLASDPVAGVEPAAAVRILTAAEQIDAEALGAAIDGDEGPTETCSQCSASFAVSVLREFWCSEACQRAWQAAQVHEPQQVYFAGSAERFARARQGAALLLAYRFGAGVASRPAIDPLGC